MDMVPSVDFLSVMKPRPPLRSGVVVALNQPASATLRLAEAQWLREVIRARSRRSEYFSGRLFSDPGWDLLLNLYLAELRQMRIAVTDLGNLAGVPLTTALRWIDALMKEGLVARQKDPYDARRFFVGLTTIGSDAMRSYCESLPTMVAPFNE